LVELLLREVLLELGDRLADVAARVDDERVEEVARADAARAELERAVGPRVLDPLPEVAREDGAPAAARLHVLEDLLDAVLQRVPVAPEVEVDGRDVAVLRLHHLPQHVLDRDLVVLGAGGSADGSLEHLLGGRSHPVDEGLRLYGHGLFLPGTRSPENGRQEYVDARGKWNPQNRRRAGLCG